MLVVMKSVTSLLEIPTWLGIHRNSMPVLDSFGENNRLRICIETDRTKGDGIKKKKNNNSLDIRNN